MPGTMYPGDIRVNLKHPCPQEAYILMRCIVKKKSKELTRIITDCNNRYKISKRVLLQRLIERGPDLERAVIKVTSKMIHKGRQVKVTGPKARKSFTSKEQAW